MPYEEEDFDALVAWVRLAFTWPKFHQYSDDMDDWLALAGMETYTERRNREVGELIDREDSAKRSLMCAGPGALPAVRRGLRRSGKRWRMVLLEFMEKHGGEEEDKVVLRLVAVRNRDPLASPARDLLEKWGEDTSNLYPQRRTTPTPSELLHQEKLARLVAFCREPRKVRDMMRLLGLHNRKNFTWNYLCSPILRGRLEGTSVTSGPLRDCYQATAEGLEWVQQHYPDLVAPPVPCG